MNIFWLSIVDVHEIVLVDQHVMDMDSAVQLVEMTVGSPSIADDVGARRRAMSTRSL